jgi:hypothetical protein
MRTDTQRLQLIPTSPDISWLFWITLCFGIFLAIYAPYRYAVAHRGHIYLSLLSPFFDFYQGILLNCAWLIAMFDEARGARMRW